MYSLYVRAVAKIRKVMQHFVVVFQVHRRQVRVQTLAVTTGVIVRHSRFDVHKAISLDDVRYKIGNGLIESAATKNGHAYGAKIDVGDWNIGELFG